jgi:hypothetical protein
MAGLAIGSASLSGLCHILGFCVGSYQRRTLWHFFVATSGMIAIGTGMIMILTLRGKSRLAGILFMLIVPIIIA